MDTTLKIQAVKKATPFLKNGEGFRARSYRHKKMEKDGSWKGKWEPWTIGYGFTYDEQGRPFDERSVMDRDRADRFFDVMILERADDIIKTLPNIPLTVNQLAALISLHHNIGPNYWNQSSVKRYLLEKRYTKAADAFLLWKRGNTASDLLERRKKERTLFLTP